MAMRDGVTLAVQPRGDGGLTFYAALKCPENWVKHSGIGFNNTEGVQDYLINHYENWNPFFFSLLKACQHFVPRPLNYFPNDVIIYTINSFILQQNLPNATLILYPDSNHGSLFQYADTFNQHVNQFLMD
jgi:hypothetical protein